MAAQQDIPIAYASPVAPPDVSIVGASAPPDAQQQHSRIDLRTATHINGGGSSRINLPADGQESHRLSGQDLQMLGEQGYTHGLAEALAVNKRALPLSIWVVDNSGSMAHRDGHRLVAKSPRQKGVTVVDCTRWKEMQETVEYHAQMAALLKSPTVFRLLNDPGRVVGPQQFSVAERGAQYIDEDLAIATSTIQNASPGGVTPLVEHLREIRSNVAALAPTLRRDGTKVVIVLATDGIPTDDQGYSNAEVKRQFVEALRSLEGLPVWVVVRLCTDEDAVVSYWNDLDANLELSLEVLDDFSAEAAEIHEYNKWLNYGLPLHRMREMGFHNRLFDLLDERSLAKDELRDFFKILFGVDTMSRVPDPEDDWNEFVTQLANIIAAEQKQWNPMTKRMEPWVDLRQLKKQYGKGWLHGLW